MSNIYIQEPPTNGKVLLKTTVGDVDVELWSKEAPKACRNFVQLCLEGYYDGTAFHRVVRDFIVQGGDPTDTGSGGESIYGAPFKDEFHQRLRFVRRGLVAMANAGAHDNGSQFFFTMAATPELQNKHTIFGKVVGDTLYNMLKLQDVEVNEATERPMEPHRVISTEILNNPFDDIVPRQIKRLKREKEDEKKIKSKSKATKNFSLLSFGDEAEDDEEQVDKATESFRGKSKSSHDLTDDPRLSSIPAVEKDAVEEEKRKKKAEESPEDKNRKTDTDEAEAKAKPAEDEGKRKVDSGDDSKKGKTDTKEEERKRKPSDSPDSAERKKKLTDTPESTEKKKKMSDTPESADKKKKSPDTPESTERKKKSPESPEGAEKKKKLLDTPEGTEKKKKSPDTPESTEKKRKLLDTPEGVEKKKSPEVEGRDSPRKKGEGEEDGRKAVKEEGKEEARKKKMEVKAEGDAPPEGRKRKAEDGQKEERKKRSREREEEERRKRKAEGKEEEGRKKRKGEEERKKGEEEKGEGKKKMKTEGVEESAQPPQEEKGVKEEGVAKGKKEKEDPASRGKEQEGRSLLSSLNDGKQLRMEELKKEQRRLQRDIKDFKKRAHDKDKVKVKTEEGGEEMEEKQEEEEAEESDLLAMVKKERQKYKLKQRQLGRRENREDATLAMLARFQTRLTSARLLAGDYDDDGEQEKQVDDDDDADDMSWMRHKLHFEDETTKSKVIDANVHDDDRYSLNDPRNPLTQRRRETSKKSMREKR